jgi:hypothetical protein
MHKVTKKIETAEHNLRKGKAKAAERVLKAAASANEKLVKIDRDVRDPALEKYEKIKHKKGCK